MESDYFRVLVDGFGELRRMSRPGRLRRVTVGPILGGPGGSRRTSFNCGSKRQIRAFNVGYNVVDFFKFFGASTEF